ncbi:hypothetical protein L21SP3_00170 [Sedimentisphaera cyanobacteriorum]|uniref:UPF0235 protein L21SP3_00170 n=1 Tax=Sedimentisphaera cyanobacteriorum TaxID=1940790 RepID=A0A1Q2HMB4_9BACT|nr:DUF167 domain-containing protein [Sedimentisphaera cyanobacteriorum]AQQ08394.1 hypothetical protein L21SP3_00170 [Sedimentisphaera cyanobacteriorum]
MADRLKINEGPGWVELGFKIVPGSSRTAISGCHDGMIKVKVAAPPEKGKANKELISYLASRLNAKKKDIELVSGASNPVKRLKIYGAEPEKIMQICRE